MQQCICSVRCLEGNLKLPISLQHFETPPPHLTYRSLYLSSSRIFTISLRTSAQFTLSHLQNVPSEVGAVLRTKKKGSKLGPIWVCYLKKPNSGCFWTFWVCSLKKGQPRVQKQTIVLTSPPQATCETVVSGWLDPSEGDVAAK